MEERRCLDAVCGQTERKIISTKYLSAITTSPMRQGIHLLSSWSVPIKPSKIKKCLVEGSLRKLTESAPPHLFLFRSFSANEFCLRRVLEREGTGLDLSTALIGSNADACC